MAVELQALSEAEITQAFGQFKAVIAKGTQQVAGFQVHGVMETQNLTAYWQPKAEFWVTLDDESDDRKYWISFGTEDPTKNPSQGFDFQINVQRTGNLWVTAGTFAKDQKGHLYYLHTGRLGSS